MQRNDVAPPFGLAAAQPAFDRATRTAKLLFGALESSIVLLDGERAWRSRLPPGVNAPTRDFGAEYVIGKGRSVWIENAAEHPDFRQLQSVKGEWGLRFFAAAPVCLRDGSMPGIIGVFDQKPHPYNAALARGLEDLAAGVADECDRARADAELARTRNILTAFAEGVPVSLMMLDREMRVIKASPRLYASLGLDAAATVGRCVYDVLPEFFDRFRKAFDRVLAGETIIDNKLKSGFRGSGRWLHTEVTPWRDESGAINGILVAAHDITHLCEALERAERSEQRLKVAVELANVHIYEIDHRRRELAAAGVRLASGGEGMAYEDHEVEIWRGVHPKDRPAAQALWAKHIEDGTPYRMKYRLTRPDGPHYWVDAASEAIRGPDGQIERIVGALRNIDAEKRNELELVKARDAADAANRAKSTFLATMSHEIRTPLNGVLGMAQAMAADGLSDVQRERLDVIRQSGETLLAILNDVLDISKIEAGKMELEQADFCISEVARGAHAAFTALANKKGLSFDLAVRPAALGVYRGDSTRVRQILYNLIANALKFTEAGEVRVVVDRVDDRLQLLVSDTGIGIAPERLSKLFEKFEQADASTTRRFGGTGLGLSICRELARLMGGEIEAASRVGEGTQISVALPLQRTADRLEAPPAPPPPAAEPDGTVGALRVLAAEDNSVNQLVLKTLLHQIGIEPVIVGDGAQAVAAWAAEPWDVILMDVQMPVMDGPAATAAIRKAEAEQGRARTPIIALTANAMAHQVAEYLSADMDGFVAKPIEINRLYAALEAALAPAEQAAAA